MSNLKQWYLGAAMWADDHDDSLPPANMAGRVYNIETSSDSYQYYTEYVNIPFREVSSGTRGIISNTDNVGWCPSLVNIGLIDTPGDHHWDHFIGYITPGFGYFNTDIWGSTKLSRVGTEVQGYNGGPAMTTFLSDWVVRDGAGAGSHAWLVDGQSHRRKGGNIFLGDGSGHWIGSSGWVFDTYKGFGGVPFQPPLGYYTQAGWAENNGTAHRQAGALFVFYPSGTGYGWNHQPAYYGTHRSMFGYRSEQ
jgi:hypothetical protein